MDTIVQRRTAQIHIFPTRQRATSGSAAEQAEPVGETGTQPARAVFGSGWYHEAAIEEAERERSRSFPTPVGPGRR